MNLKKFILVLFVTFIAYGQTLKMYFWQDDSALIFKLQNQIPAAGSFGIGIVGDGPYKYLVTPFAPFFSWFGINPLGYFAIGLITYLLATLAFYVFTKRLFEEEKTSYIATLIFASGYVGSDIMFRVINSWQTNIGLILAFLMLERFVKFLKTRSLPAYFSSLTLYFACTEFVFIRSHSLILPIFFIALFFNLVSPGKRKLFYFILAQIPFWLIFKFKYLSDASFGAPGISSLIKEILLEGKIEKLSSLFANIGNVFIPTPLQTKSLSLVTPLIANQDVSTQILIFSVLVFLVFVGFAVFFLKKLKAVSLTLLFFGLVFNLILYSKAAFWYIDIQSVIAGLVGLEIIVLTVFWSLVSWQKNKKSVIYLFIGLIFVVSQIFGYYIQYPTAIFSTVHRYFSYALIGYAIFFATLINWLKHTHKKTLSYLLLGSILIPNLILGFNYQRKLVETRSEPTRQFYLALKKSVPEVEKGDVFYFDVSTENTIPTQFGDFFSVGSMPETTALAIYYNVDRYDVVMLTDYDELIAKLANGEIKLDKLHTFFYGPEGLVNTTVETQQKLAQGSNFQEVDLINPRHSSITAMEVSFQAKITKPKILPTKFSQNTLTINQKREIVNYLIARKQFYKESQATSLSDWKFREIRNILDNDYATPWQGHRIYWGENRNEVVTLDLGKMKNINRLVWQNWKSSLSPLSYDIETSIDGKNWTTVKKVIDAQAKKDGEIVVDEFKSVDARFVNLKITKTITDDSPAITEIEVVESKFSDVDIPTALNNLPNPVAMAKDITEWNQLWEVSQPLSRLTVTWQSNKKERYSNFTNINSLISDKFVEYSFVVPGGGTTLERIMFQENIPADIEIKNMLIRNLSLQEIKQKGLVKEFEEN